MEICQFRGGIYVAISNQHIEELLRLQKSKNAERSIAAKKAYIKLANFLYEADTTGNTSIDLGRDSHLIFERDDNIQEYSETDVIASAKRFKAEHPDVLILITTSNSDLAAMSEKEGFSTFNPREWNRIDNLSIICILVTKGGKRERQIHHIVVGEENDEVEVSILANVGNIAILQPANEDEDTIIPLIIVGGMNVERKTAAVGNHFLEISARHTFSITSNDASKIYWSIAVRKVDEFQQPKENIISKNIRENQKRVRGNTINLRPFGKNLLRKNNIKPQKQHMILKVITISIIPIIANVSFALLEPMIDNILAIWAINSAVTILEIFWGAAYFLITKDYILGKEKLSPSANTEGMVLDPDKFIAKTFFGLLLAIFIMVASTAILSLLISSVPTKTMTPNKLITDAGLLIVSAIFGYTVAIFRDFFFSRLKQRRGNTSA
jgi:hypothetical protein